MPVKSQSSLSGPGSPSVVGPGGFAIGGVGARTPHNPFKFFTPLTNSPSSPVPILGWDNDADYQVPNDYNNALYMLNVTECTLGDSPELPPPNTPATDIILMGWQGYLASKARMMEYDDRTIVPIITSTVPVMDWTPEFDNQKSNDYNLAYEMLNLVEYSLGDNPEAVNYGQGVLTGWDTDADNQLSNALDYSIRLDPDDRVIRIFIPTQEIDNDSEQQFSTEVNKASNQDSNDTTVRIFIPVTGYDNDADQQILNPVWVSNIASDQGQDTTNFVITPFLADTYEVNQFSTDSNVAYSQYDIGQDWTQFIVVQVLVPLIDNNIDQQVVPQPDNYKVHLLDEGVELIFVGTAVSDVILMGWKGYKIPTSGMSEYDAWTQFIVVPVFNPAIVPQIEDTQSGMQAQSLDMFDERSNLIVLPKNVWDNDSENQLSNDSNVNNLASDNGIITNFIILPFNDFSTDAEYQLSNSVLYQLVEDDRGVRIIIPLQDLTLDADNQVQQAGYYKDHLADETVEKITLNPAITQLIAYDTDAENQISNAVHYALLQEVDDRQVLVPIPPGSARDIILMGWKGYKVPTAAMTEPDRNVELQITPPPAAPTMSSHDIDQYGMISTQIMFQSDDQGNVETTNFIILVPFVNIVEGLGEAEDE